jgi:hypothetical protein
MRLKHCASAHFGRKNTAREPTSLKKSGLWYPCKTMLSITEILLYSKKRQKGAFGKLFKIKIYKEKCIFNYLEQEFHS